MRTFNAAQTLAALPMDALVAALRRMFVAGCQVPQRQTHAIDAADGSRAGTVLIMPAWQVGHYFGVKTVTIFPGNAQRNLPALSSVYTLYDANTGVPLASLDGDQITARRTAAASALAASMLARRDASRLLVVGAGRVAALLPQAYGAVLPISQVQVWARDAAKAQALAALWQAQGIDALAVTDLPSAAAKADVVSCATLSTAPLIQGAWLRPGSHLDLIGGFTPQMVEADDACFVDARLFVDTQEALQKSGDLLGPRSRGVISAASVQADLAGLCQAAARGERLGRQTATEHTVFKSVGTALEDLAAAILVYENAL